MRAAAAEGTRSPSAGARRLSDFLEDRRAVERRLVPRMVEFRMPLHREHVALALAADRLDHAVGLGPGLDVQAAAERPDRLVVDRGHYRLLCAAVQARKARAGLEADRVAVLLVGVGHVYLRLGKLRTDVLVQRAAEGHVDELRAAANAQHGLARLDELVYKLHLVDVAQPV